MSYFANFFNEFRAWGQYRRFSIVSAGIFSLAMLAMVAFMINLMRPLALSAWIAWFEATTFFAVVDWISYHPYLKLFIIFTPLVGSLIQMILGRFSDQRRDISIVFWTFLSFLMTLLLYPQAQMATTLNIRDVLMLGLSFRVDLLGFSVLLVSNLIWLFVMMYSHHYMLHEAHRNRFYFFLSLTLSSIIGTLLAGDLLTMFLFFELMTLSSFMLVTHGESPESLSAGYQYLFIGVFGGLMILLAIILQVITIGTLNFEPMAQRMNALGPLKYVIIGLLVTGFGIKAGMAPVHVWLPKAHPVAPTPASALLSGILIKIGAYGLLRTMLNYAFPESVGVSGAWDFASGLGYAMIWLGLITMFVGAFLALLQFNAKKLLAYSSISQMGYILLGIGLMSYMGVQGSMAYAGTLYHIINHALFKSVLFMVVGVIYLSIHELDMRKMGGLYRRLPITAGIALIASMAIAGIPLANGFISKTLIHHALEKAIVYGHPTLILVEWLFILVSAGTVAYFIKFYRYIFLGYIRKEHIACAQSTKIMELAMGGIVLAILVIGLRPHWLLDYLIVPTLYQRNFDLAFIEKYVLPLNFFAREDLHLMLQISALGSLIYLIMERYQLFNVNFKMSFTVEKILMYPINKTLQYYIQLRGKRLVDYWNAYNPYIEDKSMSALKQQGILGRIFTMSNLFTRLHENDLIRNDAFIYAVILTLIVSFLLLII